MLPKKMLIHIPSLVFILLILPYFKIPYIDQKVAVLDTIFNVLRLGTSFGVFFLLFIKKTKLENCMMLFLALDGVLLLSTILNGASIYSFVSETLLQGGIVLLTYIYVDEWERVVPCLMVLSEILVYLNLFFIIIKPNGLYISKLLGYYHNWILGYKNQFICFFLVFFVIAMSYYKITQKKIRCIMIIFAMLTSLILAKSTTSIIAFSILILIVGFSLLVSKRIINPIAFVVAYIVAFFSIVFSRHTKYISVLVGKDATLTGRTYIWDRAWIYALKSPIIGNGVITEKESTFILKNYDATSAHNTLMELFCRGGIFVVIIFLALNVLIIRKLYMHRQSFYGIVIGSTFFILNIAGLVEYYKSPILYAIYGLVISIDRLVENDDYRNEKDMYKWKKIINLQ